jgi:hypothetical protein
MVRIGARVSVTSQFARPHRTWAHCRRGRRCARECAARRRRSCTPRAISSLAHGRAPVGKTILIDVPLPKEENGTPMEETARFGGRLGAPVPDPWWRTRAHDVFSPDEVRAHANAVRQQVLAAQLETTSQPAGYANLPRYERSNRFVYMSWASAILLEFLHFCKVPWTQADAH